MPWTRRPRRPRTSSSEPGAEVSGRENGDMTDRPAPHLQPLDEDHLRRRLVQQGSSGLYVNNVPVKDVQAKLEPEHLLNGQFFVMRAGKSNHKIVVLETK